MASESPIVWSWFSALQIRVLEVEAPERLAGLVQLDGNVFLAPQIR